MMQQVASQTPLSRVAAAHELINSPIEADKEGEEIWSKHCTVCVSGWD
jgi:hypothetical protein